MYRLKTSAAFDSAHFLKGYNGKCANIHGHHWVIEAEASCRQTRFVHGLRPEGSEFGGRLAAVR